MLWFCDLLILNKDRVFIAVRRDAIFYARYVKVVPFVGRRYLKEVLFLPKIIFQRERVGPRVSVKKNFVDSPPGKCSPE